jgi:heptaprenyl diphosphate synthase
VTPNERWSTRRVTRLGFLASVGTALFVLESFIPLPVPFLKIGLANISTLLALVVFGPADAILVVVIRVVAGSLLTGAILGPSFFLAICAGVGSALAMALVSKLVGVLFGIRGLSVIGAAVHVLVQIFLVALVYVRNGSLLYLLPILFITALVGGLIVGSVSAQLLPALSHAGLLHFNRPVASLTRWRVGDAVVCVLLAAAMGGGFVFGRTHDNRGVTVLVQVDGHPVQTLSLLEEKRLNIRGLQGNVTVETHAGMVRVVEADCPNHICVRTGWRSKAGEAIVCVPNKTVIRILGEDDGGIRGVTG